MEPLDPSSTGLGIPLAEYVENYIVAPMTDGLHNILRSTVQHLSGQNTLPLPKPIASQIDLSLNTHPSIWHNLTQLKQITSEAIDMAALIRFPAELFLSKPMKGSRTKYRRFETAAEALRYAVEDLRMPKAFGAWLEVGDERFNSSEIQRLYEAEDYPLRKPE